jgi:hypothetical protein
MKLLCWDLLMLMAALLFVTAAIEQYLGSSVGVEHSCVSHSHELFVSYFVGVKHEHPGHLFFLDLICAALSFITFRAWILACSVSVTAACKTMRFKLK